MSIFDHIKPSKSLPVPTAVDVSEDKRILTVRWDDGKVTTFPARLLRGVCPCAACVDEWTNKRRHDPAKVPEGTTIQGVQAVGNYAVALAFSDDHATGIFTWELFRELASAQSG